jgi:hypothetical protein
MRLLEQYIKNLLVESRFDDAKKIDPELKEPGLEYLSNNDPSGNDKYLMWMVRQKNYPLMDRLELVKQFHRNIQRLPKDKRDINKFVSMEELSAFLDNIAITSKRQQKKDISKGGVERVYEDDNVLAFRVNTEDAACKYGAGTKWCISAKRDNRFIQYSMDNVVFYFLLNKDLISKAPHDKYAKVAIAVGTDGRDETFDATDTKFHVLDLLSKAETPEIDNSISKALARINVNWAKNSKSVCKEKFMEEINNNPKNVMKLGTSYKIRLASDFNTQGNVLEYLAGYESYPEVLLPLTGNPSLTIKAMKLLSNHDNFQVRAGIAINEKTPINILRELSKDDHEYVKFQLIRNIVAMKDKGVIDILLSGECSKVREVLAWSSYTPMNALFRLAYYDNSLIVRERALKQIIERDYKDEYDRYKETPEKERLEKYA